MSATALVVLLAARLALVTAVTCPDGCSCKEAARGISSLACDQPPESLPNTTGVLSIWRGPLDLPGLLDALANFTVTDLTLSGCDLDLANVTFDRPEALRFLDLSDNLISELPDERIQLKDLRSLDVSRNQLQVLDGSPFRALPTLQALNLSGNSIENVSAEVFHGLRELQSLDLSMNRLDSIAELDLEPLSSLQRLNLSRNQLEMLSERCFSGLARLQQLDVSWNRLTRVAPGTLQSLPSLSRLLLAGNSALGGSASEDAGLLVGTGRRLQTIDASRTGLRHVPAALTHSVRTLRLAGNAIGGLRCGDLDSYPLLQLLDVMSNALTDIEEDALGRLEMLAVLYLTDNRLRAIPRSLPDGLRILHLEFNEIEQIVAGDLLGLARLEVLLLNDNAIKVVQEGAFGPLSALVSLDLSRNPIAVLPAGALSGPVRLQTLRLASLPADPPAEDATFPVNAPEHLVRLDLNDSPGLARQLLADTAALVGLRELQELSLARASVTELRSDLLHFLPQLRDIHLAGDPLNCSDLLWLALWMRRQDQPEYGQIMCASPPDLYGTALVDLQGTDMAETDSTTTTSTTTTTTAPSTTTASSTTSATTASTSASGTTPSGITSLGPVPTSTGSSGGRHEEAGTTRRFGVTAPHRSDAERGRLHLFPIVSKLGDRVPAGGRADSTSGIASPTDPGTSPMPSPSPGSETTAGAAQLQTQNDRETSSVMKPVVAAAMAATADRDEADGKEPAAGDGDGDGGQPAYPLLLAVAGVALGAGLALSTLATHVRRRREREYSRHQDIEVKSLASVQELW